VRHRQHPEGEAAGDVERGVGRPVVDDDDLKVGVVHLRQRGEAGLEVGRLVVGADDDRHPWPVLANAPQRPPGPRAGCRGRAPRATSGVGEAELPGRDLLAADDPVVGPAEDEGASNTRLVDHIELRLEGVCLLRLAADACCCGRQLDPELTHQQWQVADGNGEVPQVAREGGGVAQEDVGGDQVEARDLQVLGARVRAVTGSSR